MLSFREGWNLHIGISPRRNGVSFASCWFEDNQIWSLSPSNFCTRSRHLWQQRGEKLFFCLLYEIFVSQDHELREINQHTLDFFIQLFCVLFCLLSSLDMPMWVCLHSISLCHLHLNLYKSKAKFYLVMVLWSHSLKFLVYGKSHWSRKTSNQMKYLVSIFQWKNPSNSGLLGLGEC